MIYQMPLPPKYSRMADEAMVSAIHEHKRRFGRRLVILGHHYQQDEVIQFADFTGDSLKLSQLAAEQEDAEFVLFCGVHFMAESADILTHDRVKVILPDLSAGCSMADMAAIDQLEECWECLSAVTGETVVPITYVNSSAAIKAFVGGHGGACCTSSNARNVLAWALQRGTPAAPVENQCQAPSGRKVLFLPDQHLGRNTAYAMGWPLESMALWDPHQPMGGLTPEQIRAATILLWKGHCSVHALFKPEQIDQIRALDPDMKVLVHPEVDWEVVQKADLAGSTEFIIRTIAESPPGSKWAVATEIHLVHRLAKQYEGVKTIRLLSGVQCLCTTMYRIDMKHMLWCLDELAAGRIVNQIRVDPETRTLARLALDRMLALRSPTPPAMCV